VAAQTSVADHPSGTRSLAIAMFTVLLASYAINAMDRQHSFGVAASR
jgi:hypothetical protein